MKSDPLSQIQSQAPEISKSGTVVPKISASVLNLVFTPDMDLSPNPNEDPAHPLALKDQLDLQPSLRPALGPVLPTPSPFLNSKPIVPVDPLPPSYQLIGLNLLLVKVSGIVLSQKLFLKRKTFL